MACKCTAVKLIPTRLQHVPLVTCVIVKDGTIPSGKAMALLPFSRNTSTKLELDRSARVLAMSPGTTSSFVTTTLSSTFSHPGVTPKVGTAVGRLLAGEVVGKLLVGASVGKLLAGDTDGAGLGVADGAAVGKLLAGESVGRLLAGESVGKLLAGAAVGKLLAGETDGVVLGVVDGAVLGVVDGAALGVVLGWGEGAAEYWLHAPGTDSSIPSISAGVLVKPVLHHWVSLSQPHMKSTVPMV